MTKEELIGICNALVSIAERECCDYGFTEDIDRAEEYLNESETDFLYKEKWERLQYLINKAVILMRDKYSLAITEHGEQLKLWQELQTSQNVSYLVYQLDHTRDVAQVDIAVGGINNG